MREIKFRAWDKKKKRMMKGYEVMPRWCEIYPDDDYEIIYENPELLEKV